MESRTLGRYELLAEIGKGAMGVVFKARDPRIDRILVVKTLRRDVIDSPDMEREFVARFYREAKAAGKLSHPSIVTIHDVDRDEKVGLDFIAMEYVAGASLQELISTGAKLPPEQAVDIALQVADALDYAHENGVIHRDIKPANLILREDGVVKITDFGIARLSTSDLTKTGEYVGTPNYMSPEQIMGDPIDGRADQFALAIVLYQVLTGVRPFSGDNLTTITYKIVNEDPVPPIALVKELPIEVSRALMRGLAKDRTQRYPTCREMVVAVQAGLRAPSVDVDATRAQVLGSADLASFPQTLVGVKRKVPQLVAPHAASLHAGEGSGGSLSLLHEIEKLDSSGVMMDAVVRDIERSERAQAAKAEEKVFDVDESAATKVHDRTPIPKPVRPAPPGLTPADEKTQLAPAVPEAVDDEKTLMASPSAPSAAASPHPSPAPATDEKTRLGPPSTAPALVPAPASVKAPARPPSSAPSGSGIAMGLVAVLFFVVVLGGLAALVWVAGSRRTAVVETTLPPATMTPATQPPALEAKQHRDLGITAFNEKRYDDAEQELTRAAELDPSDSVAKEYLESTRLAKERLATPEPSSTPEAVPTDVVTSGPTEPAPGPTTVEMGTPTTPPAPETSETKVATLDGTGKEPRPAHGAHGTDPKTPPVGATKGPALDSVLKVHFEHNLKKGHITIDVGGRVAFNADFTAKKRTVGPVPLPRRIFDSTEDYTLEVPSGDHEVAIHIVAPDDKVDTSGKRSLSLESGQECEIELGVGRVDKDIEISKRCK